MTQLANEPCLDAPRTKKRERKTSEQSVIAAAMADKYNKTYALRVAIERKRDEEN